MHQHNTFFVVFTSTLPFSICSHMIHFLTGYLTSLILPDYLHLILLPAFHSLSFISPMIFPDKRFRDLLA